MTAEEHAKLVNEYGEQATAEALATADDWLLSKGKTQKDYAAFMRNWLRRNAARDRIDARRNAPKRPGMIDTSGDYYAREKERMKAAGFDVVD